MALSEKTPAVYMIRCKVNNKVYIGSTKDIGKRMKRWLYDYHHSLKGKLQRNQPILADMVKYGWDNFEFKILNSSPDMFDADTRSILEIELIVKHQSILPEFGYNATIGGESGANKHRKAAVNRKPKAMFLYDTETERIWFHFKGTKSIPNQIGCKKDYVPDAACRGKLIKHRYFVYYVSSERREICAKYIKDLRDRLSENGNNTTNANHNYKQYIKGLAKVDEFAKELGLN